MGLPGSGKTTLARELTPVLEATWLNADEVRNAYDDWDFSVDGRERQAKRMYELSRGSTTKFTIIDMVCPTEITRRIIDPDYVIWMNTLTSSRYEDTNKVFVAPISVNHEIRSFRYQLSDVIFKIRRNSSRS